MQKKNKNCLSACFCTLSPSFTNLVTFEQRVKVLWLSSQLGNSQSIQWRLCWPNLPHIQLPATFVFYTVTLIIEFILLFLFTTQLLSRKDKATFDRLDYLMSKEDNYKRLRDFISSQSMVSCIPYLGRRHKHKRTQTTIRFGHWRLPRY